MRLSDLAHSLALVARDQDAAPSERVQASQEVRSLVQEIRDHGDAELAPALGCTLTLNLRGTTWTINLLDALRDDEVPGAGGALG